MWTRAWALALALSALAPMAMAEQGDTDVAREHYTRGEALFRAGDFQAALAEFRAAHSAAPHPVVLKSQAECQERLGNVRGAVELFERYLAESPGASDRADVEQRIGALRRTNGRVRITSDPPGAIVTLDGIRLDERTPLTSELPPGDHAAAIELEGYQMELREFRVEYAAEQAIAVTMTPLGGTSPPPPDPGGGVQDPGGADPAMVGGDDEPGVQVSTPVWVMIGVAGAGLITGVVTGSLALADQGDFDDGVVNERPQNELEDLGDSGRIKALVADVAFGVAAAAAVTGIILFFVQNARANAEEEPAMALTPTVTDGGGGVSAAFRF